MEFTTFFSLSVLLSVLFDVASGVFIVKESKIRYFPLRYGGREESSQDGNSFNLRIVPLN